MLRTQTALIAMWMTLSGRFRDHDCTTMPA